MEEIKDREVRKEKEPTLFVLSVKESAGRNGSGHFGGKKVLRRSKVVFSFNLEREERGGRRRRTRRSSSSNRCGRGSRSHINGGRRRRNPKSRICEECGWRREDKHTGSVIPICEAQRKRESVRNGHGNTDSTETEQREERER